MISIYKCQFWFFVSEFRPSQILVRKHGSHAYRKIFHGICDEQFSNLFPACEWNRIYIYIYRYKYLHINFRVTCMHALECMGVNHALLPTFTREYDDSKPMRFVKAWHCCRDPDRGLIVHEDWMHRACMSWPSCDLLLKGVHWTLLCWCKLANVYKCVIYI